MRLSLHLLKFELCRLRWVLRLTWLPAVGTVAFFLVPDQDSASPFYRLDLNDMGWFWTYAWVMLGLMLLAALMAGAKAGEDPCKAFGATRPVRRRHVAGAAAMLLAIAVLPGAVAYGGILAVAEFGMETALAGAAQALGVLWCLALTAWSWARLWHAWGPLLVPLGLVTAMSRELVTEDFKNGLPFLHPPVDRLVPLLVLVTLPGVIAVWLLRRPPDDRRALMASCAAPAVLLLLWGGHIAWKRLFPGKLETSVFGSGAGVLVAEDLTPQVYNFGPPVTRILLSVPDEGQTWDGGVVRFSWRARTKTGGREVPEADWSDWEAAAGSLKASRGQATISYLSFDDSALTDCTRVDLRLRIRIRLAGLEAVETGIAPGTKVSGIGWWAKVVPDGVRGRIAPGMGVSLVFSDRASGVEPVNGESTRDLDSWFEHLRYGETDFSFSRYAALTDVYVRRYEECVRVIQVDGVEMVPPVPPKPAVEKPQPVAPPVQKQPEPPVSSEPFAQEKVLRAWPADQNAVPGVDAGDAEVAYFAQILRESKTIKLTDPIFALVRAKPRWFIESAAHRELISNTEPARIVTISYPGTRTVPRPVPARWAGRDYVKVAGVMEQALVSALPESFADEVCRRLWGAPWLLRVVEARCWEEKARPFLLQSAVTDTRPIPGELLRMIRGFADPAFNGAMRRSFALDPATLTYWQSMPGLAEELEPMIAKNWKPRRYYWPEERKALLAAGFRPYLESLLKKAAEKNCPEEVQRALRDSVLDAAGNPPPWPGRRSGVPKEFLDWCRGLSVDDFTFDQKRRRFVRKPDPGTMPP